MSLFGPKIKKVIKIDKEALKEELAEQINDELTEEINALIKRQLKVVKAEQVNLYSSYATLNADIGKANTNIENLKTRFEKKRYKDYK